jgi:hypothetical protein
MSSALTTADQTDAVLIRQDACEQDFVAIQFSPAEWGDFYAVHPAAQYQRISFSSLSDIVRLKPAS